MTKTMAILKRYIFTVENPILQDYITILLTKSVHGDLVPRVTIETFEGEYKTPSEFNAAVEADIQDDESEKIYNVFSLWGAGVADLIDKLCCLQEDDR